MTLFEVKRKLYDMGIDFDSYRKSFGDYGAILAVRDECCILPELDVYGTSRKGAEWVFVDMTAKQDTGQYGEVIYFGGKD